MSHPPYRDPNRKFKSLSVPGMSCLFIMFVNFAVLVTHSLPVRFRPMNTATRWPQNRSVLPGLRRLGHFPNSALSCLPFLLLQEYP